MKDKNLNPASLIITAVALVILVVLLVQAANRKEPFVPTPPSAAGTAAANLPDLSSDPTGLSAALGQASNQTASTTPAQQPVSVCYALNSASDTASLQLTTSDGQNATGTLSESSAQQPATNGTLEGTLAGNSDGTSATFTGQYIDAMSTATMPETITLGQTQAQIGSLTLPRVDCTQ